MGLGAGGAGGKLTELRVSVEQYLDNLDNYRAAMQVIGGDGDEEVPRPEAPNMPQVLQWYISCKEHHCLLVTGGLLDQPYWLWTQMEVAGDVYERVMEAKRRQHAALQELESGR